MDQVSTRGAGAFGTTLRRLSERLDREVQAIYRDAGFRFEPRWFAVFTALRDHGPLTVGELAQRLGISHPAVSQVRAALQQEGLIDSLPDPADGRSHRLALSAHGVRTAQQLAPLWAAIQTATEQLLAQTAPGLLAELHTFNQGLDARGLRDRVEAALKTGAPD